MPYQLSFFFCTTPKKEKKINLQMGYVLQIAIELYPCMCGPPDIFIYLKRDGTGCPTCASEELIDRWPSPGQSSKLISGREGRLVGFHADHENELQQESDSVDKCWKERYQNLTVFLT